MNSLEAFILGAVQGLAEFLPVSSSGHLVIFQHIFGIEEGPITFDVLVHMGTLIAVFIAFRDDILNILKHPFDRLTWLIIVGCIPAGIAGYLLAPVFEKAFESLLVVGIGLIITGLLLKVSEYLANQHFGLKTEEETTYKDVIFIGIMQAIAIIPGISRSGSTIAAGLVSGLDREFAARYSFLLSIPVILGAGVLQLKDLFVSGIPSENILPYIIGPVTAALFGYFAITVVMKMVRRGNLSVFSYYCWTVGSLTLLSYYFWI
ncbi:MAG: undecaprenyl-diphosphatase UppP [Syntrophomonadaceae bacterium]|nr:undecaprenyl-diphosphatase UppP [Syntrophomonadaceae bacterium]MDD3023385.1 undecaprenyl-diphosphatase UppP [Syntrophomonadaceae bacterium]